MLEPRLKIDFHLNSLTPLYVPASSVSCVTVSKCLIEKQRLKEQESAAKAFSQCQTAEWHHEAFTSPTT